MYKTKIHSCIISDMGVKTTQ